MAFLDEYFKKKDGSRVKVRIPSSQGGSDRNIYFNGSSKGYYLGNSNDYVYKSGSEVSRNVKEFIKNYINNFL